MRQHKTPISRRTLLRASGVALGLPWLEAMLPTSVCNPITSASENSTDSPHDDTPIRLAVMWSPNGIYQNTWTPKGEGKDFELSPLLQPLASLQDQLFVPTNLWNQASNVGDGHYVKCSGFLTCTTINKSLGIDLNCNGRSMDQIAADLSGKHTPLRSLELGTDPVTTGVDTNVGYTRVYGSHISWNGPTNPLAKEINPAFVFERLFRASNPKRGSAKTDQLLLDRVLQDAKELRSGLGANDRQRMDEYLQSVRDIEKRLQRSQDSKAQPWKPLTALDPKKRPPEDLPEAYQDHVQLMLDMIALAFQTDTTRVSTFMFGNAVSNRNFSFLDGVSSGHHEVSHHQNSKDKLRQYERITQWHVQQYAYLVNKLNGMKEGDATVLDRSMILYGSGLRDGNSHNPHNLPVVVAGNANGRFQTGNHMVCGKDTPMSNLYVSMLQAFGCSVDRFADSTGSLRA